MPAEPKRTVDFLRRYIGPESHVLVVGPGNTPFIDPTTPSLARRLHGERGRLVIADVQLRGESMSRDFGFGGLLDYRDSWRELSKEFLLKEPEFVQADGRQLPFKPSSFDAIVDHATLHWLTRNHKAERVAKVLAGYLDKLRPGGKLLLMFRNEVPPAVVAFVRKGNLRTTEHDSDEGTTEFKERGPAGRSRGAYLCGKLLVVHKD